MLFFFLILILLSKGPYRIYCLKREGLSCVVSYVFSFFFPFKSVHVFDETVSWRSLYRDGLSYE